MSAGAIIGEVATVQIGGRGYRLRPTLRAAMGVLEAGPGYEAALGRLRDVELDFALSVLAHGLDDGAEPPALVDCWSALVGGTLADDLVRFVMILANGGEPLKPVDVAATGAGKALSHADFHARLFKIGTGWLGWTPGETLDAAMPAIVSAYVGRQEMLAALFGGEAGGKSRNGVPLDQKFRMAFAGARKVKRPKPSRAISEGR